jgi:hypothetical protein
MFILRNEEIAANLPAPFTLSALNSEGAPTSKSVPIPFSALRALYVSAFSSPNVDALDAASNVSPLSAILTKNTRGGGTSQAPPKNSNPNPSVFNCFSPKSFTIRTSAKHARNPFAMNTSKTNDLKSFRIRTYEKKGGGPPSPSPASLQLFLLTTHYPLLTSSPLKPLPQMAHPYTCTCKKGPAAREPRYSPCAAS